MSGGTSPSASPLRKSSICVGSEGWVAGQGTGPVAGSSGWLVVSRSPRETPEKPAYVSVNPSSLEENAYAREGGRRDQQEKEPQWVEGSLDSDTHRQSVERQIEGHQD